MISHLVYHVALHGILRVALANPGGAACYMNTTLVAVLLASLLGRWQMRRLDSPDISICDTASTSDPLTVDIHAGPEVFNTACNSGMLSTIVLASLFRLALSFCS